MTPMRPEIKQRNLAQTLRLCLTLPRLACSQRLPGPALGHSDWRWRCQGRVQPEANHPVGCGTEAPDAGAVGLDWCRDHEVITAQALLANRRDAEVVSRLRAPSVSRAAFIRQGCVHQAGMLRRVSVRAARVDTQHGQIGCKASVWIGGRVGDLRRTYGAHAADGRRLIRGYLERSRLGMAIAATINTPATSTPPVLLASRIALSSP